MRWNEYIKDKIMILLLQLTCALALGGFLKGVGVGNGEIALIYLCWVLLLGGYLSTDYWRSKKRFEEWDQIMQSLDQKYLFAEVIEKGGNYKEKLYFSYLKKCTKSMIEHVTAIKTHQTEYKEFIEGWIHEIKVPITSIKLRCENNKNEDTRKILAQAERMDRDVEKVLYYARSGNVEHDFMIAPVSLKPIIEDVIAANKQELIQNRVRITTEDIDQYVYTDGKWLQFILGQILINSVKYRGENPLIEITAKKEGETVCLSITDNGIGIRESEIKRVFQRGFTGSNGRGHKNATGLGLYLCKKLCTRLKTGLDIESEYGAYTRITLIFSNLKKM